MPAARRSRRYGIVAASVAVHVALLALVAIQAPRLRAPAEESGPPMAVIPVLILPRAPPAAAAPGAQPTPIRLHRRPQRFTNETSPIAPLVVPTAPAQAPERPAQATGPKLLDLPSQQDALAANARNALRSRRNCDDTRLSRAEREACWDRFMARGADAPQMPLGIDPGKESALARAARLKEETYNYKRSAAGGSGNVGTGRNAGGIERPGDPHKGLGASSQDIGRSSGNDERGTLRVPF